MVKKYLGWDVDNNEVGNTAFKGKNKMEWTNLHINSNCNLLPTFIHSV